MPRVSFAGYSYFKPLGLSACSSLILSSFISVLLIPLLSLASPSHFAPKNDPRAVFCDPQKLSKEIKQVNQSKYWRAQIQRISKELQGYHIPPCGRSKLREEGLYLFAMEAAHLPPAQTVFNTPIENFELAPEAQGAENSFIFQKILRSGNSYPSLHIETDNFVIHDLASRSESPFACSPKALIASVKAAIKDLLQPQQCPPQKSHLLQSAARKALENSILAAEPR